ncbi:MAG: prolyl oligopeptidase family serine peptidase [Tepidiformaceae bacterium]
MRGMIPDDLYRIAWLGECDISPDGRLVAFPVTRMDRENDTYKSAVWVVPADGSAPPRQFTAGEKRDSSPRFSPDGKWLAFVSERGEKKPQLYVLPTSAGEGRCLTDLPFGAAYPVWSPDSTRIAFAARTGTPPDPDTKKAKPYRRITTMKYKLNGEGFVYDRRRHLFVVDVESGDCKQVTDGDWDDSQPCWSPDGREVAFISARHDDREYDSISDVFVTSADGSDVRRITSADALCKSPSVSPDGRTIAFLRAPMWPSNATLWAADVAGGNLRAIDPAFDRDTGAGALPGAVAAPRWLGDGSIVSIAADRGRSGLIVAREGQPTRWVAAGDRMAGWYSVSADGTKAVVSASTVTNTSDLFLIDLIAETAEQLTRFQEEMASEAYLAPAERTAAPTEPGVEVDCWIMKPAGFEEGNQYPVLLNVHGGPFGQYGETFFDEFQVYAGAGYGVVFCNPRGSSGQDTAFARALVGDMGGPDYRDVLAAFEAALERMPWADRSRLGVMGGSYGGFMTTWMIGHDHRFKAAVSERAVNDWYSMQGASDIGGTFNRQYLGEGAVIQDDLELLLRQSPLTFAKDIRTPVLILHSEDDLRCPMSQAEQLFVLLKQQRKDVEFVRFPDESHEMSRSGRPSHRVDRFEVILEYFGRKLNEERAGGK